MFLLPGLKKGNVAFVRKKGNVAKYLFIISELWVIRGEKTDSAAPLAVGSNTCSPSPSPHAKLATPVTYIPRVTPLYTASEIQLC